MIAGALPLKCRRRSCEPHNRWDATIIAKQHSKGKKKLCRRVCTLWSTPGISYVDAAATRLAPLWNTKYTIADTTMPTTLLIG